MPNGRAVLNEFDMVWTAIEAIGPWRVLFEISVIYLLIYGFIVFCEGTRGAGVLKGLALSVIIAVVGTRLAVNFLNLERIGFLLTVITPAAFTAIIVILQPELRRGLVRLSQAPIFGELVRDEQELVVVLVRACQMLSKSRIGALFAIERDQSLNPWVDRGTILDAEISSEVINTIFYPGTALHDGAVVIQKGRIAAAGCLLPLSENEQLGSWAGTRHRAAVGLTEESDAVTIVVSEETGGISICVKGEVYRNLDKEELAVKLRTYYSKADPEGETDSGKTAGEKAGKGSDK
jgi:diadenylate cyclase